MGKAGEGGTGGRCVSSLCACSELAQRPVSPTGSDGPGSLGRCCWQTWAQERENLSCGWSCDPGSEMSFADQEEGKGGGSAQDLQPLPGFVWKQLEQLYFVIFGTECWLRNQFILSLPKLKQKVSLKMRRKRFASAWEKCFNQPKVNRLGFFVFWFLIFLCLVLLRTVQGFSSEPVQRLFILPSSFFIRSLKRKIHYFHSNYSKYG